MTDLIEFPIDKVRKTKRQLVDYFKAAEIEQREKDIEGVRSGLRDAGVSEEIITQVDFLIVKLVDKVIDASVEAVFSFCDKNGLEY